jgi:hypothetical protein
MVPLAGRWHAKLVAAVLATRLTAMFGQRPNTQATVYSRPLTGDIISSRKRDLPLGSSLYDPD